LAKWQRQNRGRKSRINQIYKQKEKARRDPSLSPPLPSLLKNIIKNKEKRKCREHRWEALGRTSAA
jgi:hypothetical protein